MSEPKVVRPGLLLHEGHALTNFSKNVPETKAARYYIVRNGSAQTDWKAGVANLAYVVREAEKAGVPARAIATAWSFSPCMTTTGFAVNTLALSRVLPHFGAADLTSASDVGRVVHVQAGARVGAVNDYLMSEGRSLRTMGGRGGQTLGGAIATGSHGSQIDERALADQVRGLHVIGRGGESVWIQGATRPLVTEKWAKDRGMRLHQSDDALNAATVNVGCFGLVHSLAIEIVDGFNLAFRRKRVSLTPDLRALMRTLDFGAGYPLPDGEPGRPFHFEVVINPYATGPSELGVSLTVCRKAPFNVPEPAPGGTKLVPGAAIGDLLSALAGAVPALVPSTLGGLLQSQYPEREINAPFALVFPRNVPQGFLPMASELAIAVADADKALDAILHVIATKEGGFVYPGLVSFRYGRATSALIGFSAFEPTCTIEFPCLAGVPGTGDFFHRVWTALDLAGVSFRRHWGQVNFLTKARTASDYGERLTRWKTERDTLLGKNDRTFVNAYTDAAGLTA